MGNDMTVILNEQNTKTIGIEDSTCFGDGQFIFGVQPDRSTSNQTERLPQRAKQVINHRIERRRERNRIAAKRSRDRRTNLINKLKTELTQTQQQLAILQVKYREACQRLEKLSKFNTIIDSNGNGSLEKFLQSGTCNEYLQTLPKVDLADIIDQSNWNEVNNTKE